MTSQGGCFSLLKFVVFTVNFVLWLVGLGILGVSLWLLFDSNLYLQTSADQRTDYYLATYILLGSGALVTIMGFLGCCGAWKQSSWMLGTFVAFLIIIFFVEIGVGIMVYFHGAPLEDFIKTSVKQTVQHNYNENNTAAMMTFDKIQEGLECCGTDGPKSWIMSSFNNYNFEGEELGVSSSPDYYSIPRSCCRRQETTDCSNNLKLATQQIPSEAVLFKAGCVPELGRLVDDNILYVLGGLAALAFMEIFGIMFSLCLCCAVKRIEDMKA